MEMSRVSLIKRAEKKGEQFHKLYMAAGYSYADAPPTAGKRDN